MSMFFANAYNFVYFKPNFKNKVQARFVINLFLLEGVISPLPSPQPGLILLVFFPFL